MLRSVQLEKKLENWKSILKWEMEDSLNSSSVAFSKDGQFIYLIDSRDFNSRTIFVHSEKLRKKRKEGE